MSEHVASFSGLHGAEWLVEKRDDGRFQVRRRTSTSSQFFAAYRFEADARRAASIESKEEHIRGLDVPSLASQITRANKEKSCPPGWVEVVRRYRLWSSLTDEERRDSLRRLNDECTLRQPYLWKDLVRDRDAVEANVIHGCAVAVESRHASGAWVPCPSPVHRGNSLCARHGGATSSGKTLSTKVRRAAS